MEGLTVRLMSDSDVGFALSLTTMEEWSDIRSDFASLISYRPAAAFIAELNGQSVSMISAVSYGSIGFIGSLIVLPDYRNQGIGTALMKHAIEYLENTGARALMLDAVQKAVPVYERLGFNRVCNSSAEFGQPWTSCEWGLNTQISDLPSEVNPIQTRPQGVTPVPLLGRPDSCVQLRPTNNERSASQEDSAACQTKRKVAELCR